MKPRLLLISRKWPPAIGGMETYSVELDASLQPHFEITRKVLPGKANGRPPGLIAYAFFLLKTTIYCLLHANRFSHVVLGDLVLFPAALCCRLKAPRQKRLVVVYGLDLVYFKRKGLLPSLYGAYFWLFRKAQGAFDGIVAISGYTAKLAAEAGLKRVHVINPSLPHTALTEDSGAADALIPSAFLNCGSRRILQFGRLVPRKGAAWFAVNVLPKLSDVEFFVVGASYDAASFEILRTCARTCYLGPQPSNVLAAMIRQADIVVMPNIALSATGHDVEGFGLVAIEASSLGGLLVASRLHGIEDAVLNGATGILVEPADAVAWQIALTALLDEPANKQQQRRATAREKTRAYYSRERLGNDILKCFASTS